MKTKTIILVGNPDSGKSNFIGRLWLSLQSKKHPVRAAKTPSDISYVESIAEHLLQGQFAPRTDRENKKRDFEVEVKNISSGEEAIVTIPDVSGELWKKAVETLEIPSIWMNLLKGASGALLFVRVLSDLNVQPIDWVTSKQLLAAGFGTEQNTELSTQINLIELVRFLQGTLKKVEGVKPKLVVIVTAWDRLGPDERQAGPDTYLKTQFPLFFGRLQDLDDLDVRLFGSSIVGGDFSVNEFVKKYQSNDSDNFGYIITKNQNNEWEEVADLTLPIEWLLG